MPTTSYSPDEQCVADLFATHDYLAEDLSAADRALANAEAHTAASIPGRPSRRSILAAAAVVALAVGTGGAARLAWTPRDSLTVVQDSAGRPLGAVDPARAAQIEADRRLTQDSLEGFDATLDRSPRLILGPEWQRQVEFRDGGPADLARFAHGVSVHTALALSDRRPSVGEVEYPDGARAPIPVMSPAEALDGVNAFNRPMFGTDVMTDESAAFEVTGMTLSTTTLHTVEGDRTVPAWAMTIADSPVTLLLMAIPNESLIIQGSPWPVRAGLTYITTPARSPDATEITLQALGDCGIRYEAAEVFVAESATTVAIGVRAKVTIEEFSNGCPFSSEPPTTIATAHLDAPLGDRVLLDVASGTPMTVP